MAANALRLVRGYAYLSGAEAASKIITFAAVAYLARVVGPAEYGYVEFAAAVVLCAGLIVDQGLGPYGAREIAKAPERTTQFVAEIVAARFILAVVAYGAVIAFALIAVSSATLVQLIIIFGASLLATPLLLQWVFQGHSQMGTVALIQMIRQGAYALVVFTFVHSSSDLWFVAVAEVTGVCSAAVYGVLIFRKRIRQQVSIRLAVSKQLLREGVPIGLSQMFWMVRMFGATVIVGLIATPDDVGFFGAAMRILIALHAFVWLYFFNLLPSLSQAWRRNDGSFAALIARSLHGITWLGILGGLIWVLVAQVIVLAIYGPAFVSAGVALQWLAGVGLVAGLSGHYRFALIAAGYQNREMMAQALGSAMAILLIPFGYAEGGPAGAAAGLVIAEIVVWGLTWSWARDRLGLVQHTSHLVRPLIGAGLAIGLLQFLAPLWLSLQIACVITVMSAQAVMFDPTVRSNLRRFKPVWLPL